MIIIKMYGGLGNQLFQYSLFCYLKSIRSNVYLDIGRSKDKNLIATRILSTLVNITDSDLVSIEQYYFLPKNKLKLKLKTFLRLIGIQPRFLGNHFYDYNNPKKNIKLFKYEKSYLEGYWQNEFYLSYDLYKYRFKLKSNLLSIYLSSHSYLNKKSSLLIHVRGGDYRDMNWLLDRQYYINAVKNFEQNERSRVFVITNDLSYLEDLCFPFEYEVIDSFENDNSDKNIFLFMIALNIIISNSTFSWWGAYLNKFNPKVVVPNPWNTGIRDNIYIPDSWIKQNY
jgi:hypothetical protein